MLRALFRFDEAISPATFSVVYLLVCAFIAAASLVAALGYLARGEILEMLAPIGIGVTLAFALRLLGDIWIAILRTNDRLAVLIELQRAAQSQPPAAPAAQIPLPNRPPGQ